MQDQTASRKRANWPFPANPSPAAPSAHSVPSAYGAGSSSGHTHRSEIPGSPPSGLPGAACAAIYGHVPSEPTAATLAAAHYGLGSQFCAQSAACEGIGFRRGLRAGFLSGLVQHARRGFGSEGLQQNRSPRGLSHRLSAGGMLADICLVVVWGSSIPLVMWLGAAVGL
jgi:hypothetical protein